MPFDAIGCFVMTKAFRGNTGITSVFYGLGVNDD
jgi:hypothetical protein